MAVYSMTGYAGLHANPDETGSPSAVQIGIELRSVNSRFLDLSFKLHDDLRASEPALRELLARTFKRGKIEIRGWVEGRSHTPVHPPSMQELQRLVHVQHAVQAWLPQSRGLSVVEVLALTQRASPALADLGERFIALAERAAEALRDAREREGRRLSNILLAHCATLSDLVRAATPLVPQVVEQQRQRFLARWTEALSAASPALDPAHAQDRALAEATAYALRIDVAEELARLQSHLEEITHLLQKGGELGKRLDFLIQELHREANTLGSKSSSLELTRISVDMKVLIEQMREQVQNIE